MKRNVGQTEKILRILAGIVIIAIGVIMNSWWGAVGLVPLLTGLINWCPAYAIFGISTCKIQN